MATSSMSSRVVWAVTAVACYAALIALWLHWPAYAENPTLWRAAHGVTYAALGAVLLGALARQVPMAGPHAWRALAFVLGAIAAAAAVWLMRRLQPMLAPELALDAWMDAMLGLAVAVMLPRWLPVEAVRRWLAVERRRA